MLSVCIGCFRSNNLDTSFFVFVFFRAKYPSCLFFQYNTQLGPPYYILVDTNFINFSIKAKLDIVQSMMDCLYAKCKSPCSFLRIIYSKLMWSEWMYFGCVDHCRDSYSAALNRNDSVQHSLQHMPHIHFVLTVCIYKYTQHKHVVYR